MDAAQDHRRARINSGIDICWLTLCSIWSGLLPTMLMMFGIYFFMDQTSQEPHYSVAIESVSRLDPVFAGGGRGPKLDLEFNLTVRFASLGFWVRECVGAGMHAEVSYHGVWLASSATTTEHLCAAPGTAVDRPVVARGAGVVVPGPVLDSLAGDMRNGVQVFDVVLHGWGTENATWTCGPRRVGDGGALQMDCVNQ